MHDYHKVLHVIEQAEKEAKENGKTKVKAIHMVVGKDSGYAAEAIQLHFEDLRKGTICEDAELDIKDGEVYLKCPSCGEEFLRKPFEYNCPKCETEGEPTERGKEVEVESIEFE